MTITLWQNRPKLGLVTIPKCPFSTQEWSPCDNYRPVTIFWPCPEVVTISDKHCNVSTRQMLLVNWYGGQCIFQLALFIKSSSEVQGSEPASGNASLSMQKGDVEAVKQTRSERSCNRPSNLALSKGGVGGSGSSIKSSHENIGI